MALALKMARDFGVLKYWRKKNHKYQITNIKQITMTKIQNPNVLVIESWDLRFIWNLVLEFWDLNEFIFIKEDRRN